MRKRAGCSPTRPAKPEDFGAAELAGSVGVALKQLIMAQRNVDNQIDQFYYYFLPLSLGAANLASAPLDRRPARQRPGAIAYRPSACV